MIIFTITTSSTRCLLQAPKLNQVLNKSTYPAQGYQYTNEKSPNKPFLHSQLQLQPHTHHYLRPWLVNLAPTKESHYPYKKLTTSYYILCITLRVPLRGPPASFLQPPSRLWLLRVPWIGNPGRIQVPLPFLLFLRRFVSVPTLRRFDFPEMQF